MRAHDWSLAILGLFGGASAMATAQAAPVAQRELRIEILGASVSGGFVDGPATGGDKDNRTVPLLRVVRGWLEATAAEVQSRADLGMFLDARAHGEPQVERAAKRQPDLVLAIDFLFWFGHGYVPGDAAAGRRLRLREGLQLLDRLPCALVVGDLPDVRGASVRMIQPAQMPTPEVLALLNDDLLEWAKARPRVRVFPLRATVALMKEEGVRLPLADGELATPAGALMQGDRLHATRLGMAWLGFLLQEHCRTALTPEQAKTLPAWSLPQFVDVCDAGDDVDGLRAPAAATTAGSSGR